MHARPSCSTTRDGAADLGSAVTAAREALELKMGKELGVAAKVTLIDPVGMHLYQPGFLYVALGQANWLALAFGLGGFEHVEACTVVDVDIGDDDRIGGRAQPVDGQLDRGQGYQLGSLRGIGPHHQSHAAGLRDETFEQSLVDGCARRSLEVGQGQVRMEIQIHD